MLIHVRLGYTQCIVAICVVMRDHTAVPRCKVTCWLYLGYSCMVTTCGWVCNSPWQQLLVLVFYKYCPAMKICNHKIHSCSLFPIKYHGRYCRLDWKLASCPMLWFQIPWVAAFLATLCLHWLLVACKQDWKASLLNLGGLALCTRDSNTLLTQK